MSYIKDAIDTVSHILRCNKKLRVFLCLAMVAMLLVFGVTFLENNIAITTMSNFNELIEDYEFVLGGEIAGIKILASGVLVIGVDNVTSGLQEGDIILKLDDLTVESNQDIIDYINMENVIKKGSVTAEVKRGDNTFTKDLPINYSETTGKYELGLWVKDSSAGVGTISFYEKNNGYFAALGHGITETRENVVVPITSGAIVKARIESIKKGYPKDPGDIKGIIYKDVIGEIYKNTVNGIYGVMQDKEAVKEKATIEAASKYEIKEGEAYIYCTLEDNVVSMYKIKINSVLLDSSGNKNMIIQVIDEELLEKTGGIVQGMSGSPIVQSGKLIGAVTHVFLNDPTKGYAVFVENMIEDMSGML